MLKCCLHQYAVSYAPFFCSRLLQSQGMTSLNLILIFPMALNFQPWVQTWPSASFNTTHFTRSLEKKKKHKWITTQIFLNVTFNRTSLRVQRPNPFYSIFQRYAIYNPAPGSLHCSRRKTIPSGHSSHSELGIPSSCYSSRTCHSKV